MDATRFGCGTTMKKIFDENAFSHISTDVKSKSSEVATPETHDADLGGLWLMEQNVIY